MKLGIIVPYRARAGHLRKFRESITEYFSTLNIDYELIVVEQLGHTPFNRGKLLNVGFKEAQSKRCDYVVFHDVDMLPVEVDYSYSDVPIHMATDFVDEKQETFSTYFGGVTMFPSKTFVDINGYSNEYWGWGFEDDDLLYRCTENNVFLDFEVYPTPLETTMCSYFHGDKSYVTIPNDIKIRDDWSIYVSFKPDTLQPDYLKDQDEHCVFSIPGYDTTIGYNSFGRFKFETWDNNRTCISINTNIEPNYFTEVLVVHDSIKKTLTYYQDGKRKQKLYRSRLLDTKKRFSYIGTAIDRRLDVDIKSFVGYVKEVAIWNDALQPNEIDSIYDSSGMSFLSDFEQYSSSENLLNYYDFKNVIYDRPYKYDSGKVIDLANPTEMRKWGKVKNVIPKLSKNIEDLKLAIPKRRPSLFSLMKHKGSGFVDGKWKYRFTRDNQIKYFEYLKAKQNDEQPKLDGLSSLKVKSQTKTEATNFTMISVDLGLPAHGGGGFLQ